MVVTRSVGIRFDPEFTALPVAEQLRIVKQIDSEWKDRISRPAFSRFYDKCAVVLYYVVFPIGLVFPFLERSPFRWPVSITFIVVPVVWLFFPLLIQVFTIQRFFQRRAREIVFSLIGPDKTYPAQIPQRIATL